MSKQEMRVLALLARQEDSIEFVYIFNGYFPIFYN
jgi:hypothetical protein